MPLSVFSKRSNIAALGTCFCHAFVFIPGNYFLPLYFQAVLGATPILSGVYLLPTAIALSIFSILTGIVIRKTGQYLAAIWFGMTLMTIGTGLFIDLGANSSWAKIIIYQAIAGIGVGPNFQAPLIALQSLVPVSHPSSSSPGTDLTHTRNPTLPRRQPPSVSSATSAPLSPSS
jgi:MFS family permease